MCDNSNVELTLTAHKGILVMSNSRKLSDIEARWIYWLDMEDSALFSGNICYRVCIVVENEAGYFPSGEGFIRDDEKSDNKATKFYWTQEVCDIANERRGIDLHTSFEILDSSIRA